MSQPDKAALLEEIARFSTKPPMEPTDITLEDVMQALGRSHNPARDHMRQLVETGQWQRLYVWDEHGQRRRVWRKVKT